METHINGSSFGFVFSFQGMWYVLCLASSDARLVARHTSHVFRPVELHTINEAISPQKI